MMLVYFKHLYLFRFRDSYSEFVFRSSPIIFISGSSRTPDTSRTFSLTISMSASTSAAFALPVFTITLACFSETCAPPTRSALEPGALDQHARRLFLRVFEHRSCIRVAPWLALFSRVEQFFHPCFDLLFIIAPQDHPHLKHQMPFGDRGHPVTELHLLRAPGDQLALGRDQGNGFNDIPHLAKGRAGVHADRAAYRTRDACGELKAREPLFHGKGQQLGQRRAGFSDTTTKEPPIEWYSRSILIVFMRCRAIIMPRNPPSRTSRLVPPPRMK